MTDSASISTRNSPSKKRAPSPTQALRNETTRLKMLEAAGRVIGKYGYAGCSIARVTAKTKVAHGTFYLHFASQQDLFDAVLPVLGARMLPVIADAIKDATDVVDLERRGFEANFAYLSKHTHIYRVLTEAELFAPKAFKDHWDRVTKSYVRSLQRSKFADQLTDFGEDELETIATMLIGARMYLWMRYSVADNVVKPLPADKMNIYLKFIAGGLTGHFERGAQKGVQARR